MRLQWKFFFAFRRTFFSENAPQRRSLRSFKAEEYNFRARSPSRIDYKRLAQPALSHDSYTRQATVMVICHLPHRSTGAKPLSQLCLLLTGQRQVADTAFSLNRLLLGCCVLPPTAKVLKDCAALSTNSGIATWAWSRHFRALGRTQP